MNKGVLLIIAILMISHDVNAYDKSDYLIYGSKTDMYTESDSLCQVKHYQNTIAIGSVIAGIGIFSDIVGFYYIKKSKYDDNSLTFCSGLGDGIIGSVVLIAGTTLIAVGTPIGIAGGIKLRRLYIGKNKIAVTIDF